MIVFKGKMPKDKDEFIAITRGINDSFCFYDDLSLWEQCKLDYSFPLFHFLKRLLF